MIYTHNLLKMEYYTNYSINILKDPNNEEDAFWDAIDTLTGGCAEDFLMDGAFYAKWYNWKEDMTQISKKFSHMLFQLDGYGEEPLDIWVATFCNGECNYRELQTHWEEFDSEVKKNTSF